MRRILLTATLLLAIPTAASGQQRPLRTDTAELAGVGWVRAENGIEFLQRKRFSLSGLEGDLTRVGVASFQIGVGEYAELQISGVLRDFLSVERRDAAPIPPDFAGSSTSAIGDLMLGTKLRLATERGRRPAFAFKFAVELPNASNESGLGSDETNFHAALLASKRIAGAVLSANVGLAILGSAVEPNHQSDMLTYGVAAVVPVHRRIRLVGEVAGREGTERIGNEPSGQARAGVQIVAGGVRWDVAAVAGLRHFDPRSGIVFGVTLERQLFARKKTPRTIK